MYIKIIGAAAGGGFPQWNCNYKTSQNAFNHCPNFSPRTQSSMIASSDMKRWVLFNASPDLRQQIINTPELHPAKNGGLRSTPIAAVVLTNADIDHIAGLLTMRERQPFVIYATSRVMQVLQENPVFNVLDRSIVKFKTLSLSGETDIVGVDGNAIGIKLESFAVPGKIALFLEDLSKQDLGSQAGDTIGLKITGLGDHSSVIYIPGCADVTDQLRQKVNSEDVLLFDGTLFTDDEMIKADLGPKTGKRMGHMSMSDIDGSINAWQNCKIKRKIFVHINNSNPVLNDLSKERALVENAGWEVSYDGMGIKL